MQTYTISQARANLYNLVDEVNETHHAIALQGKRHRAVIISAEDYSAIQETLHLLSIKGMREDLLAGMDEPLNKCADHLHWIEK